MIKIERFIKRSLLIITMANSPAELTALLVDDEASISSLIGAVLKRNGINTIDMVATTQEGLDLLEKKPYNLVFTDLNQAPSGIEVYRAATAKGSEAYIMSGYAPDMQEAQQVAEGHFLMKPFRMPAIDQIVKDYIARQNPPSQS